MFARLRPLLLATSLWLAAGAAHADIYGYVDSQGSPHFATEKLDERYQLYLRGDESFDSGKMPAGVAGGVGGESPAAIKPALARYLSGHPNLKKYELILSNAARDFSVDPALLKAVMAAESGFNTLAVSPKGAVGLMQLMPATAERYGLAADSKKTVAEKLTDPKTNIRLAARYLRDLEKLFPDQLHLVLASYNAGEGAVQKYRNTVPPYEETRNYVKLVTAFRKLYLPEDAAPAASTLSNVSGPAKRVFMTIPGRRNLPPYTQ